MTSAPQASQSHGRLFGRHSVLAEVAGDIALHRSLFALEGRTGIGKTALLDEVSKCFEASGFNAVVKLNAAQCTSENQAIAALYVQLKVCAGDPEILLERVIQRMGVGLPGTLRKLFGAAVADIWSHYSGKAEKVRDAVMEIIADQDFSAGVVSQLETLDRENMRYFLTQFLRALADANSQVVIAIDNFERADSTLVELIRILIPQKPPHIAFVIAHNSEVGPNDDWDHVVADLRARAGKVLIVQALDRDAIAAWYESELGCPPTPTELDQLQERTGGRAQELKVVIDAAKDGASSALQGDYTGYYALQRCQISREARIVAELLAVINRDALVPEELLVSAAEHLKVDDIGPALDELATRRLLNAKDHHYSLSHSSLRDFWLESILARRRERLGEAWFRAVEGLSPVELASQDTVGLLPVITQPLIMQWPAGDVTELSRRLIETGQVRMGLGIIDKTLGIGAQMNNGGEPMIQNALIAARTRLELGRYREVDEPLYQAELAAEKDAEARVQILLLRMKLALRRNTYAALGELSKQLEKEEAVEVNALIAAELILNTAYRDRLEFDSLHASCSKLEEWYGQGTPKLQNASDRALARSFLKLGDIDSASSHASRAMETSSSLGSIRIIGNSKLALGEVCRYSRKFDAAIRSYREAADIALASGNRDSHLWSLLCEAAACIEANMPGEAKRPLEEVSSLLREPGYEHPLETVHAMLLQGLAGMTDVTPEDLDKSYYPFGITWPAQRLRDYAASGEITDPIPL